jgi:glycogen synthase
MLRMIRFGLEMAERYNAASDKKAQFLRALDAQAGKIEALSMSFSPRFEILMGFANEEDMRQTLSDTRHITIDYYPNPQDAAPWVENDLRVTYHLDDHQTVVKFVGKIPLTILK